MDAQTLLGLYKEVCGGNIKLPKMDDRTFTLQPTTPESPVTSAEQAYKMLGDFKPTQGWVGFQSVNHTFTGGESVPQMDDETGKLLAAEAVNSDGESLHIRYDGAGGWIVTQYVYATTDDGEYLADTVTHIANVKKLGNLRYRHFWHIDPAYGAEPYAACFIGFEEE